MSASASAPSQAVNTTASPVTRGSPACSGGDASGSSGAGGAGGSGACGPHAVAGVEVAQSDVHGNVPYALGYPPYAVDGCRLAYVARPASGEEHGELRVRDLASGDEVVLASATEKPRRPAIAGDLVAWEADVGDRAVVRLATSDGVITIEGAFDHAGEPRVTGDAVVFTAWLGADADADTDVYLYRPATKGLVAIATGPGQQRFADVSATHVAWADFAEDPDGAFDQEGEDAADIVVHDRATTTSTTRHRPGKQAFPMLGADGKIAYLDWGLVHPEPKFSAYDLLLGDPDGEGDADVVVDHVVTQQPYVRPIARGALLEWVAWPPAGEPALLRRRVDLSKPAERVSGFEGFDVFGPSASDAITLLGTRANGGATTLKAFAR